MNLSASQRVGVLAILALVMAATRVNHFAALPDASWAVFFIAGFYLSSAADARAPLFSARGATRWAFVLLVALAVLIDYVVITAQGIGFWDHYCVSPAYWFLLPAYFTLWSGGAWLRRHYAGLRWRELGMLAGALVAAVSVCYLISNGSYYWLSDGWLTPGRARSFGGWIENLGDWYLPYLRTNLMYGAIAAALHVGTALAAREIRMLASRRARG